MAKSITLAGYTISFINAVCNSDNTQTWTYTVSKTGNPSPEICYWLLELCPSPLHIVTVSTGPNTTTIGTCSPDFPILRHTIRWNNLNNQNVNGIYNFTLQGCFKEAKVRVVIKTGKELNKPNGCRTGTITGPSCECNPCNPQPRTRGIKIF